MNKRINFRQAQRIKFPLLLLSIVVTVSACVMIPYKPDFEVSLSDDANLPPGDMMVTVGPRELLEQVSEAITKAEPRIEISDPFLFRDSAFPDGDWRVSRLFQEGNCHRVSSELGVDYLVLVGQVEEVTKDGKGFMEISIGFYGAAQAKGETRISATIIDLQNELPLHDVGSSSEGTFTGVGLFYGLFVIPNTKKSAIEGLGHQIAKTITDRTSAEKARIAVLAIEQPDSGYTLTTKRESLRKRFDDGDDSYQLKVELARVGITEPLEELAWSGDLTAAIDLYQVSGKWGPLDKLAKQGDLSAAAQLKESPISDVLVKGLSRQAILQLALAGDSDAQLQRYYDPNAEDRLLWLCRAADNGNPEARHRLAMLHEKGAEGIEQDILKAQMWYHLAAISGHHWGGVNRKRLSDASDKATLEETDRLLREWQPGQCEKDLGLMSKE